MVIVKINLLPWRAEERAEKMQAFKKYVGYAFILGLLIAGLGIYYIELQLTKEKERSILIQDKINSMKNAPPQLEEKKKNIKQLTERIQSVEMLSKRANNSVVLFKELVNALPDDIFLQSLEINASKINIVGFSKTDASITNFAEALKQKTTMTNPVLSQKQEKYLNKKDSYKEFKMSIDSLLNF